MHTHIYIYIYIYTHVGPCDERRRPLCSQRQTSRNMSTKAAHPRLLLAILCGKAELRLFVGFLLLLPTCQKFAGFLIIRIHRNFTISST